jgi:hypothetical protein
MKDLLILIAKFLRPGGAKSIVADSLLIKQQLQIINRSRQRAPNFSEMRVKTVSRCADLGLFQWKSHCRGLYQLPAAA